MKYRLRPEFDLDEIELPAFTGLEDGQQVCTGFTHTLSSPEGAIIFAVRRRRVGDNVVTDQAHIKIYTEKRIMEADAGWAVEELAAAAGRYLWDKI